jgi:predicted nucleotidyltransferase
VSLLRAAKEISAFLEERRIPYAIIGGLALLYWGEPRLTHDVDVTVLVPAGELEPFLDAVMERFPPRIAEAREFALEHHMLLVQDAQAVPLDISLGIPGYEEEALRRAVEVEFPEVGSLRLLSAEDLIIHKCVAGRARDEEDVKGVLVRQGLRLDLAWIRTWLGRFRELVDGHDPLRMFEDVLIAARAELGEKTT